MHARMHPEPLGVVRAYQTAVLISIITCLVFGVIILKHRLLRTVLMRQVFCLCLSDLLVYIWEGSFCCSLVHISGICIDYGRACDLYYPVLRTLQMSSVVWTTQIAVGVALAVSGCLLKVSTGMHFAIWLICVLLCGPCWLAGLTQAYVSVKAGKNYPCEAVWQVQPDSLWTAVVCTQLLVILIAYAITVVRIFRFSTGAVVTAKLYRVLLYVAVFSTCYAPYVVLQGLTDKAYLDKLAAESQLYQVIYMLYLCAGACNVAAYGVHHWDASCWRRRGLGRLAVGNEMRVVTFLPQHTSVAASSLSSSMSTASPAATTFAGPVTVPSSGLQSIADTHSQSVTGHGSLLDCSHEPARRSHSWVQLDPQVAQRSLHVAQAYGCC